MLIPDLCCATLCPFFTSDTVISASSWTFADVSIAPVTIPAGATQAFYITVDGSGDVLYGIGAQSLTAVIAEDDRMIIYEGPAKVYQFGGQTNPRVWNGAFTYLKENGVVATLPPTKRPTNYPTNAPTTAKPTNNPTSLVRFIALKLTSSSVVYAECIKQIFRLFVSF